MREGSVTQEHFRDLGRMLWIVIPLHPPVVLELAAGGWKCQRVVDKGENKTK